MTVSYTHEGLVELLRNHPDVALGLLRDAHGVVPPEASMLQLDAAEVTDLEPAERRADMVLLFVDAQGSALYALIIEVQLAWDKHKLFRWPAYAAVLRDRRQCPVDVLVVCVEASVAAKYAVPIALGKGRSVFEPLVIGPAAVPIITDVARAKREPELAVLSALAHHTAPHGPQVVLAAVAAAVGLDEARRALYYDLVWSALGEATREALKETMANTAYEYQSDFAKTYFAQGKAEGKAEGEANAVLHVLAARKVRVPKALRERILACTDIAQLERWLTRALRVSSASELFANEDTNA